MEAAEKVTMARPKSDDRRSAILAAATRVIAADGLGAATAAIARQAGISNGSLFTYFETKAELLNALYVDLKAENAAVAVERLPEGSDVRDRLLHMWSHWLHWAVSNPEKRGRSRTWPFPTTSPPRVAGPPIRPMPALPNCLSAAGNMVRCRDIPLGFVVALMSAMAEATIDFTLQNPKNADRHCLAAFEAVWRMLG